jgi:hypothetical protein
VPFCGRRFRSNAKLDPLFSEHKASQKVLTLLEGLPDLIGGKL